MYARGVTRLLNRQAQRYLLRSGGIVPVVAAPDVDAATATTWRLEKGRPGDTYHFVETTPPHRSLRPKGAEIALAALTGRRHSPSPWRLMVARGADAYQYVVAADDPSVGLHLAPSGNADTELLPVAYGPIRHRDPAAMWLLSDSLVADARSIHLRYPAPENTSEFYNSITPYDTPPGTYFCVAGFGANARGPGPSGYAGIQSRGDGSRIAIFSLWHRMKDDSAPDKRARAITEAAHPNAERTDFGGEGSGVSVRIPFEWPDDRATPIRFAVRATADGDDTLVSAYIGIGSYRRTKLGTLRRVATGGRLLASFYSFVEDFLRNGATPGIAAAERSPYRTRRALFHNPWIGSGEGPMSPVASAAVTAYGPHPLENLSVTPKGDDFGLVVATGGAFAEIPTVIGTTLVDPAPSTREPPPSP